MLDTIKTKDKEEYSLTTYLLAFPFLLILGAVDKALDGFFLFIGAYIAYLVLV